MRCRARRGLSLLEVLISAFILLFGLVGVAALLPVGKLYVEQADRYDRATAVGHAAFHEIQTRGMLDPAGWGVSGGGGGPCTAIINSSTPVIPNTVLVDPIGVVFNNSGGQHFPYSLGGSLTILKRVTYPQAWPSLPNTWPGPPPLPIMTRPQSDYIFQSRDDLAIKLPPDPDLPATQLMQTDSSSPPNSLVRNYDGQYSWMFMAQPMNDSDADGVPDTGGEHFRVSVIVFDSRIVDQTVPSEFQFTVNSGPSGLGGGPVQLQQTSGTPLDQLDQIDRGEWILLSNAATTSPPDTRYYWYRVVSADDVQGTGAAATRWLTLQGHDWITNKPTQAAFADGVVAVYEKIMTRAK